MKFEELSAEAQRIQASISFGGVARTDKKIAKQILMYGNYFYNGKCLMPYAKHVGCGVYEIIAKPA
jgi:hypothetical protein